MPNAVVDTTAVTVSETKGNQVSLQHEWDAEQIRLLKQLVAKDLTDPEFALFGQICKRTGLDPFTRQVYAIKRKQRKNVNGNWVDDFVMTIQTGIDGYRVIAERTGEYAGGDEPTYGPPCDCGNAGLGKHPEWAKVTVRRLKNGVPYDTSERADFDEYAQTNRDGAVMPLWAKMPKRMIAKCAEALALRRAFPGLFDGVYTTEEMAQADVPEAGVAAPARTQPPASTPVAAPPVGADSGGAMEPGERFAEGSWCPTCQKIKDETAQDVLIGKLRIAKGGQFKGQLQCSGKVGGVWSNHPAPIARADEEKVEQMAAAGDIDPDDIPF